MLVGGRLELGEDRVQPVRVGLIAQLGQTLVQRVLAGVLAQDQRRARGADAFRGHDFIGAAIGNHAVLVNTGFVGKGILADNRLVGRDTGPGDAGQALAGWPDLRGVGMADCREDVGTNLQGHDDFFQRAISGAFADAVKGALDLARARLDRGQRVGDGKAQIIVAMSREDHMLGPFHLVDQIGKDAIDLVGFRITNRIGYVQHIGPVAGGTAEGLDQEVRFRAQCVLGGKFDLVETATGMVQTALDGLENIVP